jgi:hypothetical protein
VTPLSLGFEAHGSTKCGGPQDSVAGAAHDGGVLALEPDSAVGVAAVGGAPARVEPMTEASSSQTHMGATTPLSDDDEGDDEFEAIMGLPYL